MAEKKVVPAAEPAVKSGRKSRSNSLTFAVAALDMSWRLAIVVLVPIIGGFEVDKHAGTSPALTIIGFLIAMVGMFVILRWALKSADRRFNTGGQSK